MKQLYICGDSFAVPDPDYGLCWVDLLIQDLPNWTVKNLSIVGASNLLISLQVDQALLDADAILYLATAATRTELRVNAGTGTLLSQFVNRQLASVSLHSIDSTTGLTHTQQQLVREYHRNFDDLELNIYRSQCIIQSTLYKLSQSSVSWLFDQGGFEHASYSNRRYFEEFSSHRSGICLWDHAPTRTYRPYYHITEEHLHRSIADYYAQIYNNL